VNPQSLVRLACHPRALSKALLSCLAVRYGRMVDGIARTVDGEGPMAPTVTVSRASLALSGVSPTALSPPDLTDEQKNALKGVLQPEGFDLTQRVHVEELPDRQGFHLTQ
jgi:hypothetical protein